VLGISCTSGKKLPERGIERMDKRPGFTCLLIGFLSKLILLLVLLAIGGLAWGVMEEPTQLRYTQVKMRSAQWPLYWEPIRIVVVSDLNVGSPHVDLQMLDTVVDLINTAKPDLVLLIGNFMPGDYFSTPIAPAAFAPVLGKIKAEQGVLALLGKYDAVDGGAQLTGALKKAGITVLSDSAVPVKLAQKKRFWIAGFGDDTGAYGKVLEKLPKDEPVFGMVYNPARFTDIPAKVDIVFAGYTHGGVIGVPRFPMPILPTGVPARYAYGLVNEGQRSLFVTAGIGTREFPIRLNNKPEIVVATILPKQ
jgi:predicted MPP superfamily phosphohydrolase